MYKLIGILLPLKNKHYYNKQCKTFTELMAINFDADFIELGKRDSRGTYSIFLFKDDQLIQQRHFDSKKELFAFIEGYNQAQTSYL